MPLVVTSADISEALKKTDATVTGIDGTVQANTGKLDKDTVNAWIAFRDGYRAFSSANKDLPFWTLGMPAIADEVLDYEHELASWQVLIDSQLGKTTAPGTVAHDQVSETGKQDLPSLDTGTKWLIGLGLGFGALLVLKR